MAKGLRKHSQWIYTSLLVTCQNMTGRQENEAGVSKQTGTLSALYCCVILLDFTEKQHSARALILFFKSAYWGLCFMSACSSGLIGRSWAMLFVSGGYNVKIYDNQPGQSTKAITEIK